MRATDNADEILKASRNYVGEALLHPRKDDIIEFARGTVLLRVGKNDYSADIIVGTKKNNSLLLYDIINLNHISIEERSQMQGIVHEQNVQSQQPPASDNNSISDSKKRLTHSPEVQSGEAVANKAAGGQSFNKSISDSAEKINRKEKNP